MTLNDLHEGQKARIVSLSALSPHLVQKFLDLGIMDGVEVTLVHRAPLGDPIWLELKGYQITFRNDIAANIEVEVIG